MDKAYFAWLVGIVTPDGYRKNKFKYMKLLKTLHSVPFTALINLDDNRIGDGMYLRYRYFDEKGKEAFDTIPETCSVLEMMVALSNRIEESIMADPACGDRTGFWFWGMIENLGLIDSFDDNFDEEYVLNVIDRLLARKYKRNGEGGLFTIRHRKEDMRQTEIWYQMCYYLNEIA